MSYQVLSLKYRPQSFNDLAGQEHVTRTLTNAFKRDRVSQAYILTGPRGVGKTTTTSNIGMALARLGYNTLLVDADVGLRNLDLLLGLENRIIYTGLDVLAGTCRLEQALITDKRQSKLTFFPLSSNQAKIPITKVQIQELVQLLEDKYDFILIDSPPSITFETLPIVSNRP